MKLVVLPGDGIGPEICAVTVSILKKLDLGLAFEEHEVGLASVVIGPVSHLEYPPQARQEILSES